VPETLVEVTPGLLREWSLPPPAGGAGTGASGGGTGASGGGTGARGGGKDARGQVLVVGGAVQTPGAVLLAGVAALRAGAGKLAIATVASTATLIGVAIPESLSQPLPETDAGAIDAAAVDRIVHMAGSADAVLLGPGMTEREECSRLLIPVLRRLEGVAVVLDALGLAVVEDEPDILEESGCPAVLTPNPSELAYMLGIDEDQVSTDRGEAVAEAARRFGAVVSLGGRGTLIATPEGRLWHETTGGVGLGVSGSGDCAAGVVTGLLARGVPPLQAAVWAAHLHGAAGDRLAARVGKVGFLAREIADEIPHVLSTYE
jgi:hydroxyethylthiazole kinase-like uncharacterized protein yjeF